MSIKCVYSNALPLHLQKSMRKCNATAGKAFQ